MLNERKNNMHTVTETIRNQSWQYHIIRVDEVMEYDMDGNPSVIKNICFVTRPNGDNVVFNVSPYYNAGMIVTMAQTWIACDCPENKDEFGIPQKWDSISMTQWIDNERKAK
jgi:hypothetical protein